ncbi:MAG TPA: riboflavin synthase [Tepidisphaeraceae bacterium]|jgi:riboflavin synthase|nr:riboflavin synthase [Tepidisphaeraceae bacterium]
MFTGIIERTAKVIGVADGPKFRRITLGLKLDDLKNGESIAVNGVCLTAAEIDTPGEIGFDVIQETLDRTNLGLLQPGDDVNVERSLRVGDRIDGHFVQGHIDSTGPLVRQLSDEREWRLQIEAPPDLRKYIVEKGSIAIDGISLTIARIEGSLFEVALIPTTLNLTTIGSRPIGWPFNLEADILSKQVVHYLEARGL